MIFGSALIWYHTDAQRHTEHSGANTVIYKYILTPRVMCSQQLCVLYFTEWMIYWGGGGGGGGGSSTMNLLSIQLM